MPASPATVMSGAVGVTMTVSFFAPSSVTVTASFAEAISAWIRAILGVCAEFPSELCTVRSRSVILTPIAITKL